MGIIFTVAVARQELLAHIKRLWWTLRVWPTSRRKMMWGGGLGGDDELDLDGAWTPLERSISPFISPHAKR